MSRKNENGKAHSELFPPCSAGGWADLAKLQFGRPLGTCSPGFSKKVARPECLSRRQRDPRLGYTLALGDISLLVSRAGTVVARFI
jgi:hypothetical protein